MNHSTHSFLEMFKGESLSYGRSHAKKYVWQFALLFLIAIAANGLVDYFTPPEEVFNIRTVIMNLLSILVGTVIAVVMLHIYLDVAHGKAINFNHFKIDTQAKWWVLGKWIIGNILLSLAVGLGLVLLIIPGIIVAARLCMRQYFMVDKNMGTIDALRASWDATKGHVWQIIGIGFTCLGITLLGALALGIGLLWAIPTVKIAFTHMYTKIAAHHHA